MVLVLYNYIMIFKISRICTYAHKYMIYYSQMKMVNKIKQLQLPWYNIDKRITVSTSSPWELIVGYSRAVRIGNYVSVSGTTSIDRSTGKVVGEGDAYMQTVKIIKNIKYALPKAQATLNDVIRTRIYVLNIDKVGEKWEKHILNSLHPSDQLLLWCKSADSLIQRCQQKWKQMQQ